MASKFEMDPAGTRSGLSSSDAAASAQPGSGVEGLRIGAYTTPLLGAIQGAQAVRQATAEVRVAANAASQEVSVDAVEVAEATNSGALTT